MDNNFKHMNTEVLAYMGDAVYEQTVREKLILEGGVRVDSLHHQAIGYVNAEAQAKAIKEIIDDLPEDEQALVKRARNHKFHSKAKHADPVTYKWATAFEALVGYYYLAGEKEKLDSLMERAFSIIGG